MFNIAVAFLLLVIACYYMLVVCAVFGEWQLRGQKWWCMVRSLNWEVCKLYGKPYGGLGHCVTI